MRSPLLVTHDYKLNNEMVIKVTELKMSIRTISCVRPQMYLVVSWCRRQPSTERGTDLLWFGRMRHLWLARMPSGFFMLIVLVLLLLLLSAS